MKISAPCLTPPWGGCWDALLQPLQSGRLASHSAFSGMSDGEARDFSVVFGWSRVIIFCKFPVLRNCPFPGPFTRGQTFVGAFLVSTCSCFCVTGFCSSKSAYMREKENPPVHLSGSSYVCFVYTLQDF